MDGTIAKTTTTTNLQTTTIVRSSTTSSPSIPKSSSSNNNKSNETKSSLTKFSIADQQQNNPDLVQNNIINCSIKNKRKNFNPRCSSANELENPSNLGGDVDQLATTVVERDSSSSPPTPSIELSSNNAINKNNKMNSTIISNSCSNSSSNFNSVNLKKPDDTNSRSDSGDTTTTTTPTTTTTATISMNWRKLLETHQQYNINRDQQNYQQQQQSPTQQQNDQIVTINNNNCARNNPIDITRRRSASSHQLDEFNKQFYKIPNTNFTITKSQVFNDGHQTTAAQSSTAATTTTSTSTDPQSKMEFAYNAFNAVQELLNVYGLSISPGDIVDAFKKQQQHNVGGCPQPPTPPRTPISTILPSTSTINNNGQPQHHHHQQSSSSSKWCNNENDDDLLDEDSEDVRRSSTPLITLAPVSKLMASSSSSPTAAAASSAHQSSNSNNCSSLILINNNNSSTSNNNNNHHNSQSNCSNDDCGGDESTTIDDDDDDIVEKKDHHYNHHHHHHSNSNFSDRDDESGNLYDLNQCFNDDSNISSTDDPGSDGGGDRNNDECGDAGSGTCGAGINSGGGGSSVGRLSVKNVESLLDKCSMSFFSPMLQLTQMQNEDKQLHTESMKYLTKFASYLECKTDSCQLENLREHYHCYDLPCLGKTLSKKEEIIRHLKWHKKRAESLNHGFLRFSSSDDCSATFGTNCTHNRKQTHYHCFQPNCDKVYISTSDVQMHSNYHRKDSAIYQEGFQRFRATEECNADYCMFAGQRTTHFHCRRDNCRYTFKNKADMEKHKSYHIKDLQLARDGFKKFLKTEACPYERCRFSRICNHIHCVRENCHYVLHSSGQLLSHKRKHERIDSEQAYRRFKMVQKAAVAGMIVSGGGGGGGSSSQDLSQQQFGGSKPSTPSTSSSTAISPDLQIPSDLTVSFAAAAAAAKSASPVHSTSQSSPVDLSILYNNPNLPLEFLQQIHQRQQQLLFRDTEETGFSGAVGSSATPSTATQPPAPSSANISVVDEIEQMIRQCFTDNCSRQRHQTAAASTSTSDQIEPLNLKNDPAKIECFMTTSESHLHCLIKHCEAVVPRSLSEITEHMRMHELNRNAESIMQNSNLLQITSIEGFFNRKRGRPPKNRVVEVYNNAQHQSPQAIFTSFKLEKTLSDPQMLSPMTTTGNQPPRSASSSVPSNIETVNSADSVATLGHFLTEGKIQIFHDTEICGPIKNTCIFSQQMHFHCKISPRCHFATKYARAMERHLQEFHDTTGDGSHWSEDCEYFDQVVDCMVFGCSHSRVNSHFHCIKCRHSTFSQSEIERHVKTVCRRFTAATPSGDKKLNSLLNNNNENTESDMSRIRDEDYEIRKQQQQHHRDESLNLSSEKSGEDAELDCSLVKSESSEDEKVSVVRAAGTYFPQNSENTTDLGSSSASHPNPSSSTLSSAASQSDPSEIDMCQRPFCKLKKKLHQHCELCNQAFSDKMKLKIHRLKHSTTRLGHLIDSEKEIVATTKIESTDDQPQDLTKQLPSPTSPLLGVSSASSGPQQILPQNFVDNFSMQNIHLAHLALYQQNPFYYQHFYPFLGSQNLPAIAHAELLQSQFSASGTEQQSSPVASNSSAAAKLMKQTDPTVSLQSAFPFAAVAAAAAAASANSSAGASASTSSTSPLAAAGQFELPKIPHELFASMTKYKRKPDDYGAAGGLSPGLIDIGMQPAKKMLKTNKHGNFKIFKDEPIPHGYLKFRFNEDCNFPNCGYRNHQSHFHCCRNDCYYSFCDKTRFVQHTARHERLDKLMGDDFKQYRANMRCGYEDCAYNKNLGQNNKSSHFHCLKCNYICSDTNKVVAHRRQHSKMEFIRMAGFRKVANNEKCGTTVSGSTSGGNPAGSENDGTANNGGECAYSLKQTHYHCLTCDCSVLSRAQLGSHRHRVQ